MSLTKREKEVISRGSLPKTNSVCFCAEHGDPVFFCSDNVDLLRILYGKNTEEFEPYAPNFEALNHMLEAAVKNPNIGIRVGSEGQVVFNEEEKSGIEKELQIVSY